MISTTTVIIISYRRRKAKAVTEIDGLMLTTQERISYFRLLQQQNSSMTVTFLALGVLVLFIEELSKMGRLWQQKCLICN